MRHVKDFPYHVTEISDMGIIMSDGCRLSARVWIPNGAEKNPKPVILEHLPYRKRDGTVARDELTHPWLAGHGYVCIRTDMRGNGESDGLMEDEYTRQELQDACEVIEWAARQRWCNGKVGMMGISWGGFNALQVAALNPPALKAIITLCSTVDRYADDIHYKGGCLLNENFGWAANMLSYSSRPPDSALVGKNWLYMWRERLKSQPFHLSTWLSHQHRDSYWKHGSVCENYGAINSAVLAIGGWHDGYRNTVSHLVKNIKAPVKGIVGPWIHKYPHFAEPRPAIGFLQEAKRWWDHWLKDEDTGIENDPAYRAYLMDSIRPHRWVNERPGKWIAEKEWPSPDISKQLFYLIENQTLSKRRFRGKKQFAMDFSSPLDCGACSGEYFPFAYSDELPGEQSADDARSACFDSPIQDAAIDIVGAPKVRLKLKADKTTGQIAVRLCDLRPDGTSALVTHGILNLTHRKSHEKPEALVPGEAFEIELQLDQIAYHLPEGHQLRLAISNAYWPYIWPSAERVTLTLMEGTLELPSRKPSHEAECEFEEPEGAQPWRREELRPASYERAVLSDPATGFVTTKIFSDFGKTRDLEHGLISSSTMKEEWSIHPDDPLSAVALSEWEQIGGREEQMWRTIAHCEMTSNETHFIFRAKLTVWLNNEVFFEHEFNDSIERNLV